jgi:hypothetical protein
MTLFIIDAGRLGLYIINIILYKLGIVNYVIAGVRCLLYLILSDAL